MQPRNDQVSGFMLHKETNHGDDHTQQQAARAYDHNLAWYNRAMKLHVENELQIKSNEPTSTREPQTGSVVIFVSVTSLWFE